jgi:hypothetical protein
VLLGGGGVSVVEVSVDEALGRKKDSKNQKMEGELQGRMPLRWRRNEEEGSGRLGGVVRMETEEKRDCKGKIGKIGMSGNRSSGSERDGRVG